MDTKPGMSTTELEVGAVNTERQKHKLRTQAQQLL